MLIKATGVSIVSAFLLVSASQLAMSQTDTAKTTTKEDMKKKNVADVTCEDFNGVEDSFKPLVVAWAVGYEKGDDDPDEVALDIDGIEKVTPIIVEACRKEPKASFWKRAEEEIEKIF